LENGSRGGMKKIFAEIGIGNNSFFSTEFEENNREYRISKFIKPKKVSDYYLRIWLLRTVLIISTKDGFKIIKKNKNKFKLLFGISGFGK
jgi:hypothetical protein